MDGSRLLRGFFLAALIALTACPVAPAWASGSDGGDLEANPGDGAVDLVGTQPGNSGSGSGGGTSDTSTGPPPPPGTAQCFDGADVVTCIPDRNAPNASPTAPPTPGIPTITDIATFPVQVASAHNQPTGWGVVNKPTNFYTVGGTHEVTGTLLGNPATVRFTPVAWHWDYGDGTTASLATGGRPWTEASQLRPTPTSHVYTTKGDYTVTLLIDYAAEYQYAGGAWTPVAGTLRVASNDLQIITWRVKTVLVAHDCIDDPSGAGCPGTLNR